MAGLIFLAVLSLVLWGGAWVVRRVSSFAPIAWRSEAQVGVALILLAAPFVDEVIGKYQVESLCKAHGIESVDVSKARGKRVRREVGADFPLKGVVMPGTVSDWIYRDVDSGEILIQHKNYYVRGGWLMRYTPLSMGFPQPMLFSGGCFVDYVTRDAIFSKNNISLIK